MPIPGVEMRHLIGNKTVMFRMQAEAVFPRHDHAQAEQCYVLEGSLTDSDGLTVYAGDFVVMSKGTMHEPLHSKTGCTLFVAYAD
jgi:anti-sigma factor ChrR (cupin superfamily)